MGLQIAGSSIVDVYGGTFLSGLAGLGGEGGQGGGGGQGGMGENPGLPGWYGDSGEGNKGTSGTPGTYGQDGATGSAGFQGADGVNGPDTFGSGIYIEYTGTLNLYANVTSDTFLNGNGLQEVVGTWGSGEAFDMTVYATSGSNFNIIPAPAPEPASMGALGVGVIGLLRLRRAKGRG